jgi:DNA mismatch endonuclease (patch repair protein)
MHQGYLPGAPDLVFTARRKVVFVHGCFWHQHTGCKVSHIPKSRRDFWEEKLRENSERDASAQLRLRALGWRVFVVWECETQNVRRLASRLRRFLG